ncbi:hypothetical protein EJB05_47804, partial [Eragrostis curvula]
MASIILRAALPLCFFLVVVLCGGHAHGKKSQASSTDDASVYDVTEYGAAPTNGDNKEAFLAAWRAACGSTAGGNATLLFPNGTFAVGAVEFAGPCTNGDAPAVVIDGVLQPGGRRLSGDAWITFSGVNNLLVTGAGTLDGQGDQSGSSNSRSRTTVCNSTNVNDPIYSPRHHSITTFFFLNDEFTHSSAACRPQTLVLDAVTNSAVRGLRFVNSRGFHVNLRRCTGVVAEGLHIQAPEDSRNTDGIHVGASSHVRILASDIGTGDDCVSVGPGSTDVLVDGVACGPGHGISVGSLGKGEDEEDVRGLIVRNCTVRGTTNGVRIKTWPGSPPSLASNITFEDIVMDAVANPIIIDQQYCPHGRCAAGAPSLVQISDVTFRQIEGTSSSKVAVQLLCSEERPCTGVRLVNISLSCGDLQQCEPAVIENVLGTPPTPGGRSRR